ncbi:hypothetical protein IMY97_22285 [Pectobacterium versatile]|uniref:hypothetical protein n=1 Tax=Pectobacterium versatile TaxID=2488639 RepID=UPI001FA741C2|nr:hypothetical protein [Pectobacterium versatile]UNE79043.1 hypothetical protein IMY97_22285 [Pectobacterium versatile]
MGPTGAPRLTAAHTILMVRITRTRWDQTTYDNVLFQATQFITLTSNSGFPGPVPVVSWNDPGKRELGARML